VEIKMAMDKLKDITTKRIKDLLSYLGIEADINFEESDQALKVKLTNTEAPLLIGYKGENLKALQHILKLLVISDFDEDLPKTVILDIEDYRKNEEEKLKEFVRSVAEIVKKTGRPEVLSPMSSYKRRLIHMAVKDIPGVVTESIGEDRDRRILIKTEADDEKQKEDNDL